MNIFDFKPGDLVMNSGWIGIVLDVKQMGLLDVKISWFDLFPKGCMKYCISLHRISPRTWLIFRDGVRMC